MRQAGNSTKPEVIVGRQTETVLVSFIAFESSVFYNDLTRHLGLSQFSKRETQIHRF